MNEIRFIPQAGKHCEMLYAKPSVFTFYDDYFEARSEFGYSAKNDDEMMPAKDISVDEMSIYFKQHISCVEWAYSSDGEVWFFQLWHDGENSYWYVESKEKAIEIVEKLKNWKLNKYEL